MKKIRNENKLWMAVFSMFLFVLICGLLLEEILIVTLAFIWLVAGAIYVCTVGYKL